MLWTREYLQALLHSEDPLRAVFELASIWSSRPGRCEKDPHFGLLPCQYNVHLYLNYQGDVGNGGHHQFFCNPVGAYANETLVALEDLHFEKVRDVLTRAIAAFPASQVPKGHEERNLLIQSFSNRVAELWSTLDQDLWSLSSSHWEPLMEYLRAHQSEILERDGG
jgi:hypothetical protein